MTPATNAPAFYEGKAKRLFRGSKGEILHEFKNSATAFNGQKKAEFDGKGELNSKMSAALFNYLRSKGIESHFVRWDSPNILVTRELRMIPAEIVVRNIVAGSLAKRLGLVEGAAIEPPIVEWFLKDDAKGDPQVSEDVLISLFDQKADLLKEMRTTALLVNRHLRELFTTVNLKLVDFKLEFGLDDQNKLTLGDEISPDTCRIWDSQSNEKYDKDRFRFDLGDLMTGYREIWARLVKVL
jgi:phosphoribosylaminoimidazole-succinocarboxamide synthase